MPGANFAVSKRGPSGHVPRARAFRLVGNFRLSAPPSKRNTATALICSSFGLLTRNTIRHTNRNCGNISKGKEEQRRVLRRRQKSPTPLCTRGLAGHEKPSPV